MASAAIMHFTQLLQGVLPGLPTFASCSTLHALPPSKLFKLSPGSPSAAAEMIANFLKSSSHNLKYVGIDGLARIVRISPKYAAEHQLAVIDCLEDPDETLKRKTLELLYKMTKANNVEVGGGRLFRKL